MRREHRTGCILLLLLVLPWAGTAAQDFPDSTTVVIQRLTARSGPGASLPPIGGAAVWRLTRSFYRDRACRPAWTVEEDQARIAKLLDRLGALGELGIEPTSMGIEKIRLLAAQARSPGNSALLDVAATMAWLRAGMALSEGRVSPHAVDTMWAPAPHHLDLVNRLRMALDSDRIATAFDSLAPPQEDAVRLRQALTRYRAIAASGGWLLLSPGPALALDSTGQRVAMLRRRLETSGDLAPGGPDSVFDLPLDSAVRRAQSRLGLAVDGVVGAATRAALNVPATARVLQLEMNLERWRWLPRSPGTRYIMVNSAGFTVDLVDTGVVTFHARAVNGRVDWPTPIVNGTLTHVMLYPRWNIPRSIAVREILPEIRKDSGFLAREKIHVMSDTTAAAVELDGRSVAWESVTSAAFPYRLWQEPGPLNPLGRLRFGLESRFGIALHDTPSRQLFGVMSRAFSHGCIRVENAEGLAALLLRDMPGWSAESLQAALADSAERYLRLPAPIPAYIEYWTAWMDADGTVEFRPDVYHWDAKLARELVKRGFYERSTSLHRVSR